MDFIPRSFTRLTFSMARSVDFEFDRKRSTKSHEMALNYLVLLLVISWIVLPNLHRGHVNIENMTLPVCGISWLVDRTFNFVMKSVPPRGRDSYENRIRLAQIDWLSFYFQPRWWMKIHDLLCENPAIQQRTSQALPICRFGRVACPRSSVAFCPSL